MLPVRLGTLGGAKSVNVTTAASPVQLLDRRGTNNVADSSNGINKLYAQLLGAKLNGASGANLSSVASVIAAADAFLATHNSLDWAGLTDAQKSMVNGWMTTLDNYNNGRSARSTATSSSDGHRGMTEAPLRRGLGVSRPHRTGRIHRCSRRPSRTSSRS